MTAQRTTPDPVADSATGARDLAILDAARGLVIRYGVRRTTAQDIADAAGISRMTFYRAMGSVDSAVLATLTREFRREINAVLASAPAGTARERLVHLGTAGILAFERSDLITAVRESDPELLTPYLSDRLGHSQDIVLDAIAGLLAEGVRDGSLSPRPGDELSILLAIQGVAVASRMLRRTGQLDAAIDRLGDMLHAYLTRD